MYESIDFEFLAATPMFAGASADEARAMLACLGGRERAFRKGEFVYRAGETAHALALLLEGSVCIESTDAWGTTNVIEQVRPGSVFAEVYAALPDEPLMVDAVAQTDAAVLFLDAARVIRSCSHACSHHSVASQNLLGIIARKNLRLTRKISHVCGRSIRARLIAYLSDQALSRGSREFDIEFDRQQLADYLGVDRSAMSAELGRMRDDGLLTTQRRHFVLSESFE